jgi:hypothetical protein
MAALITARLMEDKEMPQRPRHRGYQAANAASVPIPKFASIWGISANVCELRVCGAKERAYRY